MLSAGQNQLYFRLWGKVRKAKPDADRHAMHRAASTNWPDGLPESHTTWNNAHMDEWIARCEAILNPANYGRQQKQVVMPQTRWLYSIHRVLAALCEGEAYAETTIETMNRHGALGGPMLTLHTLKDWALEKVLIALKKECKRRWPRKADLLGAIRTLRLAADFDEATANETVLSALGWSQLPAIETLDYDKLLIVLGALNLMSGAAPGQDIPAEDRPF